MTTVGVWIWDLLTLEGGTPPLTDWAKAGISQVFVKCGDGSTGGKWTAQFTQLLPPIKALGMDCLAWSYCYGAGNESGPLIQALNAGADGVILDCEGEWERSTTASPSNLVAALRAASTKPIYLSSFGQPDLHRGMHWPLWDTLVDGYMPQTFPQAWGLSIADALTKMYQSHAALGLKKPIYPAGYLYPESNPVVSGADVTEFLGQATAGGYDRVSLWRDGIMGQDVVDAVAAFLQPAPAPSLEDRVARIEAFLGSTFTGWHPGPMTVS